jgi:hypothetical protein
MDASGTKLEKGLLLGYWIGGPWLGIKTNASESLSWTFTYNSISWPLQVPCRSCSLCHISEFQPQTA